MSIVFSYWSNTNLNLKFLVGLAEFAVTGISIWAELLNKRLPLFGLIVGTDADTTINVSLPPPTEIPLKFVPTENVVGFGVGVDCVLVLLVLLVVLVVVLVVLVVGSVGGVGGV